VAFGEKLIVTCVVKESPVFSKQQLKL
jgi:hypothetical protein